MNREYKEKLVFLVIRHFARRFLLPNPLRRVLAVCRTCPRIIKGIKAAAAGHLTVEVLDGIAIGTSLVTGDYTTAGSVNFLLRVGEILDEWTHKKSVDDLARSMSLQVDRVWKLGDDDTPEMTPLGSIAPGDRIVVHTGHVLPLDGILERGDVIAREVADVTIETEDIRELVWLKRLSDALMGRIHRNYRFVMGFNGALIALGALGLITPATSAFLHNSSTILLSMNCLTALLEKESAIMDDSYY